ncbi:MAG: sugar transferase [Oscillospiraceae bacterium]|nr:sugar transferase [Oscillospiraceae bacterium]
MYKAVKRMLDILGIILLSPVLLPMLLILAISIKADSPGPAFFKQKRAGKNQSHFMIYKYRTMYIDTPSDMPTHMLENPDTYITKAGRFLRRTSLDELPQIINILKGEMSFIGPRPALWNQFDLINLRVGNGSDALAPGLTGLAQIRGRDELPINEKAIIDGEYAENFGFIADLKIFLGTFGVVLGAKGVKEGK